MRYLGTTPAQQQEMLRVMGAERIEGLLTRLPAAARPPDLRWTPPR